MSSVEHDGVPELERVNPRLASDCSDRVGIDWVRRRGIAWDGRDGVVYTLAYVSRLRDQWLRRALLMMVAAFGCGVLAGALVMS